MRETYDRMVLDSPEHTWGGKVEDVALDPHVQSAGGDLRATTNPLSAADRKARPIVLGVLDYFPDAILEVAHVSYVGGQQHHPGQPVHWDRSKSSDEADALV